jgi:hypothetical protein
MKKMIFVAMAFFAAVLPSAFALGSGYSGESMTLEGSLVERTDTPFAALKTEADVWSLMLPGMYGYDIPVKDGDKLKVTGFEVPGPAWGQADETRYLMVQKIAVGDKEYVLPSGDGRFGMMGRYGMMGGRRPRGSDGRNTYGAPGSYGASRGCWY